MPKIGAHVSAAVSLELSFERAKEIGAECTQIFISPPQQWRQTPHGQEEIGEYLKKQKDSNIGPNFIHGTYLINLGTQDQTHLQKSIDWLIYALNIAGELGITGVIFHTGSHKGLGFNQSLPQIVKSLSVILSETKNLSRMRDIKEESETSSEILHYVQDDNLPYLILENAAGAGNVIGDKFSELGAILKAVNSPRLKICLDTCHAFASGYDIKTPQGLEKTLAEFDREVGLENLVVLHANDSKFEIGQNKDRHANIGEGFIGRDGFENIINHPKLKDLPFILEVPGFSDNGPDKENVQLLKSLIGDLTT